MTSTDSAEVHLEKPLDRSWGWVIAAVLVHIYTATGFVLAFLMMIAAFDGRTETVLWLFLIAMIIDGTDGFLARKVRVSEATPWFDGALLDNIVDYITYTFAPMILLYACGYLPDDNWGIFFASLPLFASSYQFCRSDAKTDDHFFMGFPSYWNVLAFYVVVFDLGTTATSVLLGDLLDPGVRADPLRLPVADGAPLVHQHGVDRDLARGVRRAGRATSRPEPVSHRALLGLRDLLHRRIADAHAASRAKSGANALAVRVVERP